VRRVPPGLLDALPVHALGALGIAVVVRDMGSRQVLGNDFTDAAHAPASPRTAHHEDQHPALVVPPERGDHWSVGARRVAVELTDPRCVLEVAPRELHLMCRGRWLVLDEVVGVGCLGLGLAQRLLVGGLDHLRFKPFLITEISREKCLQVQVDAPESVHT